MSEVSLSDSNRLGVHRRVDELQREGEGLGAILEALETAGRINARDRHDRDPQDPEVQAILRAAAREARDRYYFNAFRSVS